MRRVAQIHKLPMEKPQLLDIKVAFKSPISYETPEPKTMELPMIVPKPPEPKRMTDAEAKAIGDLCRNAGYLPGSLVVRVPKSPNIVLVPTQFNHWCVGMIQYVSDHVANLNYDNYAPLSVKFGFTTGVGEKMWPSELLVIAPPISPEKVLEQVRQFQQGAQKELPSHASPV